MEKITLTKAKKEDIPGMAEYRYLMFAEMFPKKDFGRKKTRFIRQTKEYYARHLADTDQFSVCAKQKGVTIGCGTILFQKRPPVIFRAGNVTGYILNINIQPEFRRKRLATRIMRTLHTEAQRRGVYRIGLHASKAGIKLYVKLGYRQKKNYFERMM